MATGASLKPDSAGQAALGSKYRVEREKKSKAIYRCSKTYLWMKQSLAQSRCSRSMDAVDDWVMDCIKISCINIFDCSQKRKAIAFDQVLG
jgi:hypothetical protein